MGALIKIKGPHQTLPNYLQINRQHMVFLEVVGVMMMPKCCSRWMDKLTN